MPGAYTDRYNTLSKSQIGPIILSLKTKKAHHLYI